MLAELLEYVGYRRAHPGDDLTSLLLRLELSDRARTDWEVTEILWNLVAGGLDTTTALTGKLDQAAAYEKILLVDVKKLTRDDWAPVGGADSSISSTVERISELMNEIKVLVDLPG